MEENIKQYFKARCNQDKKRSNIEDEVIDLQKELKGLQKTQSTQIAKYNSSESEIPPSNNYHNNTRSIPTMVKEVNYTFHMKTALAKELDACNGIQRIRTLFLPLSLFALPL